MVHCEFDVGYAYRSIRNDPRNELPAFPEAHSAENGKTVGIFGANTSNCRPAEIRQFVFLNSPKA